MMNLQNLKTFLCLLYYFFFLSSFNVVHAFSVPKPTQLTIQPTKQLPPHSNFWTTSPPPSLITRRYFPSSSRSRLYAESGGPPKYDKVDGILREAEVVGKGSVMLHIDVVKNPTTNSVQTLDYQPGHVLALEIEGNNNNDKVTDIIMDEKTQKDMEKNNGWMRGPYTVSRCTDTSIDILIKVVGSKSKYFANVESGTPVKLGGKFKVPILDGIDQKNHNIDKIVMISTGVGVGPCIGAIEKALLSQMDDDDNNNSHNFSSFPPIHLIACYKTREELLFEDYLNDLQAKHTTSKFTWNSIISSEVGRLSSNDENLSLLTKPISTSPQEQLDINSIHYHLIGNASLVKDFKAGLSRAGVVDQMITIESYFNHSVDPSDEVVERIAGVVSKTSDLSTIGN